MKHILILLFTIGAFAQERYIDFNAHEMTEDAEYDSIYWRGPDKIHHQFTLKGSAATCRLTVVNKGDVLLEQYTQNKWQLLDSLYYVVFPSGDGDYFTPQFQITDFNEDGREDFMFLSMSTMHGTLPYSIYLQDAKGNLVKLRSPDNFLDDDTWPAARFDAATQVISCQMPGGAFGSSWEATYRLEGNTVKPLELHNENRSDQTQFDQYFVGKGSTWVQTRQNTYVALGMGFEDYDTMDVLHFLLSQEGDGNLNLYLTGADDTLEAEGDTPRALLDTIAVNGFVSELEVDTYYEYIPGFLIIDFNLDGNQDLVFYTGVDVHGSTEALIFLSDSKTKTLIKLQNTAEGTDVWDTPQYDVKTKTITCNRMAGNAGLNFTSTYKLKRFVAEPVMKEVRDFTNRNSETGEGYSERLYVGKKGKWKLQGKN